ncbi:MAG: NTP transferase domain-containing protein [Planctomycetes bacterium]|nr:NTP transferase domain-containing protein [Planctomycetota bacterium]
MPDLYVIILAGGASSRFWPLSGDAHPKYLLKPDGDHTLIESAWQRACLCTDPSRVIVVTGGAQAHLIREALPDLDASNLCVEPARRDTAAAIALGCKRVHALDAHADVLVLPADTLLEPAESLHDGVKLARSQPDYRDAIHVFGVNPARAEGGFGYIEPGEQLAEGVISVQGFTEKPGSVQAAKFAEMGYLWNIGCFLFSLQTFDRELHKHLPQHSSRLRPVTPDQPTEAEYEQLDAVSIDFGLIEKVDNLRAIKLDAAFDDIGTWDALIARLEKSGRTPQEAISISGQGNCAAGEATAVAVVGESNLLVVVSEGKVLVLKRGHGQDVKGVASRQDAKTPRR